MDAVEAALKGEVLAAAQDAPTVTIARSLPHGPGPEPDTASGQELISVDDVLQ